MIGLDAVRLANEEFEFITLDISKETNQDSVLFKQGSYSEGEILTFMS